MKQLATWLYRFLRSHRPALVGFILVAFICSVAIVGPWVIPHGPGEVFDG